MVGVCVRLLLIYMNAHARGFLGGRQQQAATLLVPASARLVNAGVGRVRRRLRARARWSTAAARAHTRASAQAND